MSVLVGFVLLGLTSYSQMSAADPVRRTNTRQHCVVWGDGPYFGMKFEDEHKADEQFNRVKRDELVAIHYDHRFREVQRHQSPRVKLVRWHRLADWCKGDHKDELSSDDKVQVGVGVAGKVENFNTKPHASLLSTPLTKEDPQGEANELSLKASSSLGGTVRMIEEELADLVSKTSSLFASMGQNDWVALVASEHGKGGPLKARISAIDHTVSSLFKSTEIFEKELTGTIENGPAKSRSEKVNIPIKAKIEALLPKIENLKKRIPALGAESILSTLDDLESKASSVNKQVADMLKGLGLNGENQAVSEIQAGALLSTRCATLETIITSTQLDIKTLETELFERPSSSSEKSPKIHAPLKVKIATLSTVIEDLHSRMSALAASPFQGVVDKLEEKIGLMQSKVMEVSKRVGSEVNLEKESTRNLTTIKKRLAMLTDRVSNAQPKLDALEEELLGSTKKQPESLADMQSLRGQAASLEVKADALLSRASSLEQEV